MRFEGSAKNYGAYFILASCWGWHN